jgi:hypothetical protein
VELLCVVQELRPVPLLQLELVLELQLVQVQVQVQVPQQVLLSQQEQALLLGQPVHCGRCSQARLLG